MEKVVFLYPCKPYKDTAVYMCRLADSLAQVNGYEVYYGDYYNGISNELLNDIRIRKYPCNKTQAEMEIFPDEPITVIMPVYGVSALPKLHPESKIVFLNCGTQAFDVLGKSLEKSKFKQIVQCMLDHNGVAFDDGANRALAEKLLKLSMPKVYVPRCLNSKGKRNKCTNLDSYNLAIYGGQNPAIYYSNHNLIKNIASLELDKTINVYVIGGEIKEDLFSDIIGTPYLDCTESSDAANDEAETEIKFVSNINIIQCGDVSEEQERFILENNVDLVFTMGLSAIRSAQLGLPTIIMPYQSKPAAQIQNRYTWLSQCSEYMLNWSVSQIDFLDIPTQPIKEVFEQVFLKGGAIRIGEECSNYALENHLNEAECLINVIKNSTLTYEHFRFLWEGIPEKRSVIDVFRTVIGKSTKRFCLLGFPVVAITKVDAQNFNVFFCCVPLFRVKKIKKQYSFNLLLFSWLREAVQHSLPKKELAHSKPKIEVPRYAKCRARILKKLENHQKIRVCLFEPRISCWQFGNLYNLLEKSNVFEPIVVVTPFFTMGDDAMVEYMDITYEELKGQGYRVIKGYDKETGVFLNIREELQPDAVFFSMFWKPHFHDNSYITKFEDIYTFLYPYGLDIASHPIRESMNFELQNKVSRYYMATKIHKGIAQDFMDNHGHNVYITGSPKLDYLLDETYIPVDVWNVSSKGKKRVIWAPHHTLVMGKDYYQLCAFLDLAEFMLELAKTYRDTVHFAFKPHPMLKPRLYGMWGKRKTDEYYSAWENGENTQLETGTFIDLFLTSDAMILDSISFIGEYTITNRPAFFTYGKDTRFTANRFGKSLMKVLYKNRSADSLFEDIRAFIDNVVLKGEDTKKEERTEFIGKYMLPENGKTAAENIYEDMCRVILQDEFVDYIVDWKDIL